LVLAHPNEPRNLLILHARMGVELGCRWVGTAASVIARYT
jgi:hypothetical protein